MTIPKLTAHDCDVVLNQEIQLGSVCISGKVHNRITYHMKNGDYFVYQDGNNCVYTSKSQGNALEIYNNLNKKVDL